MSAEIPIADQIKDVLDRMKALRAEDPKHPLLAEQTKLLKELNAKKAAATDKTDSRKYELKTPKGTKDFLPEEMAIREQMFATITKVFKRHGAVTIDTPVFELKEILTGKYGEDSKLIYDLKDQGGEICSLRYDLTVPFARFLASNGISSIKRYHIAKVYRRDNPSVNKGRMREFYQCDFDIAGDHGPMIPDAEALRVMAEILTELNVGGVQIKINHRKILDGMFEVCGVPAEKFRQISSAVDKLDKMPWEEVKKEMVGEKGLPEEVADRIQKYVKMAGSVEICDFLASDPAFAANKRGMEGVADMRLLFKYLDLFGIKPLLSFDLSLARGLDYYTGVIYEAVFTSTSEETSGVGSIAAGGRYDELVGMFSTSGKKIPCVGISIGVERVFAILYARFKASQKNSASKAKTTSTDVFIVGLGNGHLEERMSIARELWDAGISAEFTFKEKPRKDAQFKVIGDEMIPVSVVIDNAKAEEGMAQVENNVTKEKVVVPRAEVKDAVKKMLGK
ncbi:hypothetical protein HDV05_005270 [Chytridiales sp. JEL 0842]|nr:hypothetical protein HDV05_005270 [Chytridiales sp. JEL 0842]